MKHIFCEPIMYLLIFILVIVIFAAYYWKIGSFERVLGVLIAMVSLHAAITAYNKAYDLADQWLIYSIADRSIAWETRLDKAEGRVEPVFINQGGDAIAYQNLVKKYIESNDDDGFKSRLARQLNRIYENIDTTDNTRFFTYVAVSWDDGFNWQELGGQASQTNQVFLPRSVIGQLSHRVFWMTRAQCARFLREEDSFKSFVQDSKKQEKLLKGFDPKDMFDALVLVINNDYSLVVRKECLKTYMYWACERNKCEQTLVDSIKGIYYFDNVAKHWADNKDKIIAKFKSRVGLNK